MQTQSTKFELYLAGGLFLVAQSLLIYRILHGVNFFDEAYYFALPLRILFKQNLFIDDLSLIPSFPVIIYPMVKFHSMLFGSTEFLILFMRVGFVFFQLILCATLLLLLRGLFSTSSLLSIITCCSLFLPGNLPTLSYNTLGTFFLTLGLFLLFFGSSFRRNYFYFLAGISLGVSALSYITFLIIIVLLTLITIAIKKQFKQLLLFAGGVAAVLTYPSYLFLTNMSSWKTRMEFTALYGYSSDRFFYALQAIHRLFPKQVLILLFLYSGWLFWILKKTNKNLNLFFLSTPIVAALLAQLSTRGWPAFPIYLTLLGWIPFKLMNKNPKHHELLCLVYFPSVVAGILCSATSAIGTVNAQVGLMPAVLVSLLFLTDAIKTISPLSRYLKVLALSTPLIFSLYLPLTQWDESPFKDLTTRIQNGPYRGLFTSPEKKQYLEIVSEALRSGVTSQSKLMVYPNFPAGYLIAGVAPAPGILWYMNPKGGVDRYLADAYFKLMDKNYRILKMKVWYAHPKMQGPNDYVFKDSPIIQMIDKYHEPIADNKWVTLYAPK